MTSSPRNSKSAARRPSSSEILKLHNYHGYYAFNFGSAEASVRPYVLFGLGATQYGTVSVTVRRMCRERFQAKRDSHGPVRQA